ncbi:hypothetical protein ACFZDG_39200 [Kitasatospora xanthocidica]|uniref:hypothetical protein n=1 Tax=Kitasatospora xanthocidica TaxID=83382 RepID=UPI0036E471DF
MPSKPRPRSGGFAEVLAALPPKEEHEYREAVDPIGSGGFLDGAGRYWRLVRGPVDRRLAKRLAAGADEMTLGRWGRWHEDFPDRFVPVLLTPEERPAAWLSACAEDHRAYEFHAVDGRTLLYLEISC